MDNHGEVRHRPVASQGLHSSTAPVSNWIPDSAAAPIWTSQRMPTEGFSPGYAEPGFSTPRQRSGRVGRTGSRSASSQRANFHLRNPQEQGYNTMTCQTDRSGLQTQTGTDGIESAMTSDVNYIDGMQSQSQEDRPPGWRQKLTNLKDRILSRSVSPASRGGVNVPAGMHDSPITASQPNSRGVSPYSHSQSNQMGETPGFGPTSPLTTVTHVQHNIFGQGQGSEGTTEFSSDDPSMQQNSAARMPIHDGTSLESTPARHQAPIFIGEPLHTDDQSQPSTPTPLEAFAASISPTMPFPPRKRIGDSVEAAHMRGASLPGIVHRGKYQCREVDSDEGPREHVQDPRDRFNRPNASQENSMLRQNFITYESQTALHMQALRSEKSTLGEHLNRASEFCRNQGEQITSQTEEIATLQGSLAQRLLEVDGIQQARRNDQAHVEQVFETAR